MEVIEELKRLSALKKTIGLCHGCFDIIHWGHICHFEYAKKMVDILVVSITAAQYVNKGPNRPLFSDEERLGVVNSIKFVDYALINVHSDSSNLLKELPIDIYFKGPDYSYDSSHKGLKRELKGLSVKTRVIFTPTVKLSSTQTYELLRKNDKA